MAAKDIYHMPFVRALRKDGWTTTHDPLAVTVEGTNLLIDIGAERVVAAERNGERIAVEIKSFVSLGGTGFERGRGAVLALRLGTETIAQ